jgi:hypothetical protein
MRQPKKIKERAKGLQLNNFQISALAVAFNVEYVTISRWARRNHYALSIPAAQQIIKEYEKIPNIPLISA